MLKKLQVGIIAPAVALACLSLPRAAAQTQGHEAETAVRTTNTMLPNQSLVRSGFPVRLGTFAAGNPRNQ